MHWQLNDIWPVASWASLDYYYRWKALQYYAKRFFAPVMLSCEENSMASQGLTCISEPEPHTFSARLCLTNETWDVQKRTVVWELRDESSCILRSGRIEAEVKPFSSEVELHSQKRTYRGGSETILKRVVRHHRCFRC